MPHRYLTYPVRSRLSRSRGFFIPVQATVTPTRTEPSLLFFTSSLPPLPVANGRRGFFSL